LFAPRLPVAAVVAFAAVAAAAVVVAAAVAAAAVVVVADVVVAATAVDVGVAGGIAFDLLLHYCWHCRC